MRHVATVCSVRGSLSRPGGDRPGDLCMAACVTRAFEYLPALGDLRYCVGRGARAERDLRHGQAPLCEGLRDAKALFRGVRGHDGDDTVPVQLVQDAVHEGTPGDGRTSEMIILLPMRRRCAA